MSDYLNAAAQIATVVTGLSVLVAVISLTKQIRQQNLGSFFYLHKFLSQSEFSRARRRVRTKLANKPYKDWTEEDREAANAVCASYDQAHILLSAEIFDRNSKMHFLSSSWGESICHQYEALANFLDDRQTPRKTGREFFRHFGLLYAEACKYHREQPEKGTMRYKIVSGGQTGVDRAALDVAIELGLEYGGWCPKGGWAEDLPQPPGLVAPYPKLRPTPLEKPEQRTEWNVRDSDATLILTRGSDVARSRGTQYTVTKANEHRRRYLILDLQDPDRQRKAMAWLEDLGAIHVLNIAGPRESEAPGIYQEAKIFLRQILLRAQ